jgi:glycosyltransferase involved in cell wall biosynthesis
MQRDLVIVMPVYNDWESANRLLQDIEAATDASQRLCFVLVNDASFSEPVADAYEALRSEVVLVELSRNMGHQKAIAAGLAYVNDHLQAPHIVVMDSDGEDKPADIDRLLQRARNFHGVVFAQRTKRSEGFVFRLFYQLYKAVFTLLTGKKISFGNFCVLPGKYLKKVVHVPDIWNHFSGGVLRSGIPYTAVPTERGKRYHGESKMNFTRLILHGLSAVSVYADYMAIRLILLSFLLIVLTVAGIFGVAFVRLFTEMAIPGWATFTVLGLVILLVLALLLGLFLLFNVLTMKTQKTIIPAIDYRDYVVETRQIKAHE